MNKFEKAVKRKEVKEMFENIEVLEDKDHLYKYLDIDSLKEIDSILDAYFGRKIDLIIPRYENGEVDFDNEFLVVVNDKDYKETGNEVLVIKWVEGFEDTGYLIECFS